jgi:hypothetical protein
VRVLRTLILIAALGWLGKMVVDSIRDIRNGELVLHFRPGWLLASAVFIAATYFLFVWTWLYIIAGLSGQRIRYAEGARIWFVSNLSQQVLPFRVWGLLQMTAMSVEAGINPIASAAASVINTAVNIATGMAVAVIAGSSILAIYFAKYADWLWVPVFLAFAGIALLPVLIPWAFRFARRFSSRIPEQRLPPRLIAVSVATNVLGWGLYGVAFLCLNRGIVDLPSYDVIQHIAVNATSYVMGYLAIVVPAGLGVREKTLQGVMVAAQMASEPQATAVSLVSRIWQLIILVLPALIFLAYRRPPNEKDSAAG